MSSASAFPLGLLGLAIFLYVLYFVVRAAVRDGIKAARDDRRDNVDAARLNDQDASA